MKRDRFKRDSSETFRVNVAFYEAYYYTFPRQLYLFYRTLGLLGFNANELIIPPSHSKSDRLLNLRTAERFMVYIRI